MSAPDERGRTAAELLARLLGPADPELSCDECFAALDRYVELKIAAEAAPDAADEQVPGMRAHLAGCPACAEEYRSLRELLAADEESGPRRPR